MDYRRLPSGWVAWWLVLAAMLPTVMIIRLAWVVFNGSFGGYITQSQSQGMTLLAERWVNFWWSSPAITTLQIAGLLPLVLLAVIVSSDYPRALVPSATARYVATVVAVTTTLLGLGEILGFLAQFTGLMPVTSWPSFSSSGWDVFAPFIVVAFSQIVFGSAATIFLWPPRAEEQSRRSVTGSTVRKNPDQIDNAVPDAVGEEVTEGEVAAPSVPHEMAKTAETSTTRPERGQSNTPRGFPAPSASDLGLYRRR